MVRRNRGQTDPTIPIVGVLIAVIVAYAGFMTLDALAGAVTITGQLSGTGAGLLNSFGDAMVLAVAAPGLAIFIVLMLRAMAGF